MRGSKLNPFIFGFTRLLLGVTGRRFDRAVTPFFSISAAKSTVLFCILALTLIGCGEPPKVDLRRVAPAETIIYLESNDLAKTLGALTENQAFRELAADVPDFSALENIQLAIAVTSFETSESQTSADNSVINFTPRFVAIAETHAWQWQTVALIENQLNTFVKTTYGADAALEKSVKPNGKFFAWTAHDGRMVFALAVGSRIFFGNDLAAIEKYFSGNLAENLSLVSNGNLARVYPENAVNELAFGYVSASGISQIADLAGVSAAVETTEEPNGRNFIAGILPPILRNTTQEIVWTAHQTADGIEDVYKITLNAKIAAVTNETLTTSTNASSTTNADEFLPSDFSSATRYNLKNPLTAWRSLLLLTVENTDSIRGKLLVEFSNSLLEPYGVADAETFLNSIDGEILTAQFDPDGEKSAVIVTVKNNAAMKKSISKEFDFQAAPVLRANAAIWYSENQQFAAAFVADKLILGENSSVANCLQNGESAGKFKQKRNFQKINESHATAFTFGRDADSTEKIVGLLAKPQGANRKLATFYTTETLFSEVGLERRTVSDFGLIGTILKQLGN